MKQIAVLSVVAVLMGPASAMGQGASPSSCTVKIEGDVAQPTTLSAEQLHALPYREIRATGHGGADTATYAGVRLAAVLHRAGIRLGAGSRGAGVSQYVVVRAADGYRAVYAVAELDSAMTDREVWLVDRKNGAVLDAQEGPCRILVPSDRRHARSVRQVTTIEFHQVP